MPKVSVVILTKNRSAVLRRALASIRGQTFFDYEVVAVNDGSTDDTEQVLNNFQSMFGNMVIIHHSASQGVTNSRQEALERSAGENVAFLDDDDEWVDKEKLAKQVKFLDEHQEFVLVGGGIQISNFHPPVGGPISKFRPEKDEKIRRRMLLKNCFFTSTVMVRRQAALDAGGFVKDNFDFSEDYDLWLRMGLKGKMYNFQEVFTRYALPNYSKDRFKAFLKKQSYFIRRHKKHYPLHWLGQLIIWFRVL